MANLHKDNIFQRIGNVDDNFEKFSVTDCMEVPIKLLTHGRTCYHFTCISTDHLAVVRLSHTLGGDSGECSSRYLIMVALKMQLRKLFHPIIEGARIFATAKIQI